MVGRIGEPEDVAALLAFLASDEASFPRTAPTSSPTGVSCSGRSAQWAVTGVEPGVGRPDRRSRASAAPPRQIRPITRNAWP